MKCPICNSVLRQNENIKRIDMETMLVLKDII